MYIPGMIPYPIVKKGEESCQRNIKNNVRKITPTYQLWKQMVKAFFVGGLICVLGQLVTNVAIQELGMDEQQAGGFCSLALICIKRTSDRLSCIFEACDLCGSRSPCSDYRVCQFRSSSGH